MRNINTFCQFSHFFSFTSPGYSLMLMTLSWMTPCHGNMCCTCGQVDPCSTSSLTSGRRVGPCAARTKLTTSSPTSPSASSSWLVFFTSGARGRALYHSYIWLVLIQTHLYYFASALGGRNSSCCRVINVTLHSVVR